MKNSSFKIISAIIGVLFAISIIIFAGSIISGKNNDSEKAAEIFNSLAYKTATAAQQHEPTGQSHSEFATDFVTAVHDNIDQFAAISLTLNENVIYNYPPVKDFQLDSDAVIQNSQEITTLYGNTIRLEASVYKINPSNVYYKARVPFILILIGTIAAFFVLIFVPVSNEKEITEETENDEEKDTWDDYDKYDDSSVGFESEPVNSQTETIEIVEITESQEEETSENQTEITQPVTETVILENISNPVIDEPVVEEPAIETDSDDNTEDEPVTPQTLQEFLNDELSLEDSEVSVLITKINHLDKNSKLASDIQEIMIETFKNEGVLFNFNEDSYATILVETDFESAMNHAETLRTNLLKIVDDSNFNTEITIGVSSKTSRTIDADDLIYEADQAQQHAEADNPIVGLKVDPEKYNNAR